MELQTVKSNLKSTTNSLPKGIAIYLRVSSEKQKGNTSLSNQLTSIKNYIKEKSWCDVPVFEYQDIASASKPFNNKKDSDSYNNILTRPNLNLLVKDAYLKKFDTVIVYCHDRLTRNVQEALFLRLTLKRLKINLIYCRAGEQISSEDQTLCDFFDNLINNISALEADVIASRVKPNNEYNIKHNIWAGGRSPYGYKLRALSSNRKKSTLEITPIEARIVRYIFELYNLGYSPKCIAAKIKEEYPFNKDRLWSVNTIKTIINNPSYTGALVWNKRGSKRNPIRRKSEDFIQSSIVKDNIIISQDLWEEAARIKALKKNNSKYLCTDFLLKDFAYCGVCGEKLICKNYGNNKKYYFCSNHYQATNSKRPKRHISKRTQALDNIVINALTEQISSILNSPPFLKSFYDKYSTKIENLISDKESDLKVFNEELSTNIKLLDKCEKEIINFKNETVFDLSVPESTNKNNLFLDSLIELKTYIEINIKSLKSNIYTTSKAKDSLSIPTEEALISTFENINIPLQEALKNTDSKDKYRALRLLFTNIIFKVIVSNDNSIEIIFK